MNLLLSAYPGDDAVFVILLVLAQTTIVAALALTLERAFSRNPAARHGVLLTALTCVAFGLVATVALDRADVALVRLPWPSAEAEQPMSERFIVETVDVGAFAPVADSTGAPFAADDVAMARAEPNAAPTVEAVVRSTISAALMLWLVGALGLGLRMVVSWREVEALRLGAAPIDPASLGPMVDRVRRRFGLARVPAIGVTGNVEGPCSVGLIRPLILLPIGFLERFSSAHVEAVLTHETAHVARRDCAVALFQGILGALFWPHPLVRLLNRRLERAREEICDNHAVEGFGPSAYGRILLEVGEVLSGMRPTADAIGMFGRDWKLEDRVRGLLDSRRRTMTRMTLPAATLVFAAFSILTVAIAGSEPKRAEERPVEPEYEAPDQSRDSAVLTGRQTPTSKAKASNADSNPKIEELETRVYPVGDLVIPHSSIESYRRAGSTWQTVCDSRIANFGELIALIQSISPADWKGGKGGASIKAYRPTLCLVIRQTLSEHDRIADFVTQIRRLRGERTVLETRFVKVSADGELPSEFAGIDFAHKTMDNPDAERWIADRQRDLRNSFSDGPRLLVANGQTVRIIENRGGSPSLLIWGVASADGRKVGLKLAANCEDAHELHEVAKMIDVPIGSTLFYELPSTPAAADHADVPQTKPRERRFLLITLRTDEENAEFGRRRSARIRQMLLQKDYDAANNPPNRNHAPQSPTDD